MYTRIEHNPNTPPSPALYRARISYVDVPAAGAMPATTWWDPTHRKIVAYMHINGQGDTVDDDGHGTHTAGVIAGYKTNTTASSETANGVAPKAKLAFFDFGGELGFNTPAPSYLGGAFLAWGRQAGARVTNIGWGRVFNPSMGHNVYFDNDKVMDQYIRDHDSTFIAVAVGNNGQVRERKRERETETEIDR